MEGKHFNLHIKLLVFIISAGSIFFLFSKNKVSIDADIQNQSFYSFGYLSSVQDSKGQLEFVCEPESLLKFSKLKRFWKDKNQNLENLIRIRLKQLSKLYIKIPVKYSSKISARYQLLSINEFRIKDTDRGKTLVLNTKIPESSLQILIGAEIGYFKKRQNSIRWKQYNRKSSKKEREIINKKDKSIMVLVSGGVLLYGQGNDSTANNFNPFFYKPLVNKLPDIPSFYIQKFELSRSKFNSFVLQGGYNYPYKDWLANSEAGDLPMNRASYEDARAYCAWANLSLPDEWEWELAARGSILKSVSYALLLENNSTRIYPWGNDWDTGKCNSMERGGNIMPVHALNPEGASPYGVLGMCGNVSEWTDSWYDVYPDAPKIFMDMGNSFKVIRGGSYRSNRIQNRSDQRLKGGYPNLREDRSSGFRCISRIDSE